MSSITVKKVEQSGSVFVIQLSGREIKIPQKTQVLITGKGCTSPDKIKIGDEIQAYGTSISPEPGV